jgi:ABC-type branched-subunit amino acid transport system permease subunit
VVFAILILIMVFRPQGLFGEETREDDGMSTAVASLRSNVSGLTRLVPNWVVGGLLPRLAILWPQICEQFFNLDLLDASINSLGYIIMALGLNIVVGFAGLLDLGYVAFYAIGAFVMGWLGPRSSPTPTSTSEPHRSPTSCPASTSGSRSSSSPPRCSPRCGA